MTDGLPLSEQAGFEIIGRHPSDARLGKIQSQYQHRHINSNRVFDRVRRPQPRGDRDPEHALSTTRYTLTVEGIADPTTPGTLEVAVSTLRTLLATLPLRREDHESFDFFLSDADRAADFIHRDGALRLRFEVAGRSYTAVIQPSQV